jgi:hypothetical protein
VRALWLILMIALAGCVAPARQAVTAREVAELETVYAREFGFGPEERAAFHAGLEEIRREGATEFPAPGSEEEKGMIRELVRGMRGKGERL